MTQDTVVDGPGSGLQKGRAIDPELLRNINSLEDAIAAANKTYDGSVLDASREIGDGFALLENKDNLVDVPCLFLSWEFNIGDYGDFVSARVVTQAQNGSAQKYIVNDGSSGICKQLSELSDTTGQFGGLLAKHGLRRSDYKYEDPTTGELKPASTYYIDTSA